MERKVLAGVLGLGVVALGADQLWPSETSENPSALAVSRPAGSPAPAPGPAASPGPEVPAMIVAERLRALQPSDGLRFDQMRDAFRLSKAWAAELRPPEPMAKASVSLADRFRQAHRLTGVMVGERASHAVIDGRLVAVGQALDGFKLVSVTQAAAVFRSDSAQVVLQIPSAVAGAATDPTH